MKNKAKLFFVHCGGFLASATPLAVVFFFNLDRYVQSTRDGWKLGLGGGIVAVLLLLKVLGRLKLPGHVTTVAVITLLSWLLSSLLSDLTLLCTAYLVGEGLDALFFRRAAKRLREAAVAEQQADATASRVEEMLKTYIGNGRV